MNKKEFGKRLDSVQFLPRDRALSVLSLGDSINRERVRQLPDFEWLRLRHALKLEKLIEEKENKV